LQRFLFENSGRSDGDDFFRCACPGESTGTRSEPAVRAGQTHNLSLTPRNMERYGLVELMEGANRQLVPKVNYSGVALKKSF
jgi:hypothetical protein